MRTSWRKLKLVRWQVSTFTASRRRTSNKRSVVMAWTPPRERHGTLTFSSAIEIAKPLWFAHHTLLHHSVPRSKSIMILIIWHLIFQSPEFPSLRNCDNKALSATLVINIPSRKSEFRRAILRIGPQQLVILQNQRTRVPLILMQCSDSRRKRRKHNWCRTTRIFLTHYAA